MLSKGYLGTGCFGRYNGVLSWDNSRRNIDRSGLIRRYDASGSEVFSMFEVSDCLLGSNTQIDPPRATSSDATCCSMLDSFDRGLREGNYELDPQCKAVDTARSPSELQDGVYQKPAEKSPQVMCRENHSRRIDLQGEQASHKIYKASR